VQKQVLGILKNQASKTLNESLETFNSGNQLVAVWQIPLKKGLNREERLRLLASRIAEWQKSRSLPRVAIPLGASPAEIRAFCEGILIAGYEFRKYKSEKKPESARQSEVVFLCPGDAVKSLSPILGESESICRQINFCRDLVNEPGSVLDPQAFTDYARKAAKEFGLSLKIRDEKRLQSEGFHGLWTVGKGSDRPPRMVTLGYEGGKGRKSPAPHLCLVGKGITFDTGGISIKPSQGMWEMKSDMAGAATVLAALCAITSLK